LATIEQMALGAGDNADIAPFDIVFIDADKTRLLEYTETCLANDRILKKGGYMIVDNTLYKGIVLEHTGVSKSPTQENNASTSKAVDLGTLKRSRRAYQLAGKLHKFNKAIAKDNRCEVLILPFRDGLSLIRKK
jgi:caffeoyl-CoA O-methyltransferase